MKFKEFNDIWNKVEKKAKKERFFEYPKIEPDTFVIEVSKEVRDYLDELVEKFEAEEKEETESKESNIKIPEEYIPYTFGGEIDIDDLQLDEYGIDFGYFTVTMNSNQMGKLTVAIVNHMILCGHTFQIAPSKDQDQRDELLWLTKKQ